MHPRFQLEECDRTASSLVCIVGSGTSTCKKLPTNTREDHSLHDSVGTSEDRDCDSYETANFRLGPDNEVKFFPDQEITRGGGSEDYPSMPYAVNDEALDLETYSLLGSVTNYESGDGNEDLVTSEGTSMDDHDNASSDSEASAFHSRFAIGKECRRYPFVPTRYYMGGDVEMSQ